METTGVAGVPVGGAGLGGRDSTAGQVTRPRTEGQSGVVTCCGMGVSRCLLMLWGELLTFPGGSE
jgi:hypothetical protein